MAAIITGASVVLERSRTGSYGLIGTEVVGAIDAGLELLGSDAVEDPGRLLMEFAVLERIRLVDDDLVPRTIRGTMRGQVEERQYKGLYRVGSSFSDFLA